MGKDKKKILKKIGVVLDDDLFKIYHDFKSGIETDTLVVTQLIHYINGFVIPDVKQYQRLGIDIDSNFEHLLRNNGYNFNSFEQHANHRNSYKIILTRNPQKTGFPYVNILEDYPALENNYSASYERSESRDFAISHIAALCRNAKEVKIYDSYISKDHATPYEDNIELLKKLLPNKKLKIVHSKHLSTEDITKLQQHCSQWEFENPGNMENKHDRYLIIDDKIEIILTSGYERLANANSSDKGDITYIVRANAKPRFN